MSALAPTAIPESARRTIPPLVGAIAVGGLLALALAHKPISLTLGIGGGIGALVVLALALARYRWVVGLGIFLLFFVKKEPAPSDAVFLVAIAVAAVTGRLAAGRVPGSAVALIGVYLAMNLMAIAEVTDTPRAVKFSVHDLLPRLLRPVAVDVAPRQYARTVVVRAYVGATGPLGGARRRRLPRRAGSRHVARVRRHPRGRPLQGPERLRRVPRARDVDRGRRAARAEAVEGRRRRRSRCSSC